MGSVRISDETPALLTDGFRVLYQFVLRVINTTKAESLLNNIYIYINPFRTSQETHCVCATETGRLMLFGETVAVYCENHTEHTDAVRTLQETNYISATETNRLMEFGETADVYCENLTNTQIQSVPQRKQITSPTQSPTS
jgi:hypothetical protein